MSPHDLDIAVIPDARDPLIAKYPIGDPTKLRKELRMPDDRVIVAYCG